MIKNSEISKNDELISKIYPDKFSAFLIFPFKFDNNKKNIVKTLADLYEESDSFIRKDYKIKTGLDWNENMYFFPYVREILFRTGEIKDENNNQSSQYLRWKKFGNEKIFINVRAIKNKQYTLAIEDVYLHLYRLGVGILIFEIEDKPEPNTKNLLYYLNFLNLARRIYPSFVNESFDFENKQKCNTLRIACIKKNECPFKVTIQNEKNENLITNSFLDFSKSNGNPYLSKIITKLLDVSNKKLKFQFNTGKDDKDVLNYEPLVDDRMFIHAYYSINPKYTPKNRLFVHQLHEYLNSDFNCLTRKQYPAAEIFSQMIFIDPSYSSIQNEPMFRDIIKNSTYNRWTNYYTFYGFSRYSSVLISNYNEAKMTFDHHKTMYYQIAVLLFFYRGVLLNFSDRSENLADDIKKLSSLGNESQKDKSQKLTKVRKDIDKLHGDFLLFRNKFWFKEITAQDQGIEIFDLWSKKMRNTELMQDVQAEIKELFNYVNYTYEKDVSKTINILTVLGAVAIPLAIITSFFGMNLSFVTELFNNDLNLGIQGILKNIMTTFSVEKFLAYFISFFFFILLFIVFYKILNKIYDYFSVKEYISFPKLWELVSSIFKKKRS